MTRKVIGYTLLLVVSYVVFLIVQFPAARLYAWLEPDHDLPVELYQLSGSVWNGKAGAATAGDIRLDTLAWRFRPHALVTGRVEAALELTGNGARLETIAGRSLNGGYYLREASGGIPLDELAPLVSGSRMGLTGEVGLDLDRVELAGGRLVGAEGTVNITGAGVGPPADVSLGGFTVKLETTEEGIKGVLNDDGGPLQADGVFVLKPDGSYQITAVLAARDPQRGDLRRALQLIGTPSPAGKVSFTRRGTLQLQRYLPL